MTADCNREIEEAEKGIAELEQTAAEGDAFKQKIDEIRRVLTNAQRDAAQGIITKEFIDQYISKIFVTPKDDTTMLLQVKIFTGETTEKYLRKLESRTGHITRDLAEQSEKPDAAGVFDSDDSMGHTSKKMIEALRTQHEVLFLHETAAKSQILQRVWSALSKRPEFGLLVWNKHRHGKRGDKVEHNEILILRGTDYAAVAIRCCGRRT
jgi:hypothetical protein